MSREEKRMASIMQISRTRVASVLCLSTGLVHAGRRLQKAELTDGRRVEKRKCVQIPTQMAQNLNLLLLRIASAQVNLS